MTDTKKISPERLQELIEEYAPCNPAIPLGAVYGTAKLGEFVALLQGAIAAQEQVKSDEVLLAAIKAGFMACVDMGPPDCVESDDGTYTTTYTWEEPDYSAVLQALRASQKGEDRG